MFRVKDVVMLAPSATKSSLPSVSAYQSSLCLGPDKLGIVVAVRSSKNPTPQDPITVASLVNGERCEYAAADLIYADGSDRGSLAAPPTRSGRVPLTAAHITVSSGRNANNMATDDTSTYWESSGSIPHHFEVAVPPGSECSQLFMQTHDHDSYSPNRVRIMVGATASSLVLVKEMPLNKVTEWVNLLTDKEAAAVGVPKPRVVRVMILSNHSGGLNSRVSSVKMMSSASFRPKPLAVGDRVTLSPAFSKSGGTGWSLSSGGAGIVVAAGKPELKRAQRGQAQPFRSVMVGDVESAASGTLGVVAPPFAFRSTWLTRDATAHVFKVGDRVQLKPETWLASSPWTHGKALGKPMDARYGIVRTVGPVRDGVQRNVEVLLVPSRDPGDMKNRNSRPSVDRSSLYPASCLIPATRSMVLMESEKKLLEQAARANLSSSVNVQKLVQKYGLGVWTYVFNYKGLSAGLDAYRSWASIRDPSWPVWEATVPQIAAIFASLTAADSKTADAPVAAAAAAAPAPATDSKAAPALPDALTHWRCLSCNFADNPISESHCGVCFKRGKGWQCDRCGAKNKISAGACVACSGLSPTLSALAIERARAAAADPAAAAAAAAAPEPSSIPTAYVFPPTDLLASSNQSTATRVITDDSGSTYWESNGGTGTHWLQFSLPRGARLHELELLTHNHGNYTPNRLEIFQVAGAAAHSLGAVSGSQMCPRCGMYAPSSQTGQQICSGCSLCQTCISRDTTASCTSSSLNSIRMMNVPMPSGSSTSPGQWHMLLTAADLARTPVYDRFRIRFHETHGGGTNTRVSRIRVRIVRAPPRPWTCSAPCLTVNLAGAEACATCGRAMGCQFPIELTRLSKGATADAMQREQEAKAAAAATTAVAATPGQAAVDSDEEESSSSSSESDHDDAKDSKIPDRKESKSTKKAVDDEEERFNLELVRAPGSSPSPLPYAASPVPADGATPPPGMPRLQRQGSLGFWSARSFEPLANIQALTSHRDKAESTAAHHTAYIGLAKATQALILAGVARWGTNRAGETVAGLLAGVRGDARVFKLHRLCTKRDLVPAAVWRAALKTPELADQPEAKELRAAISLLEEGQFEEAAATFQAQSAAHPEAHAYLSLALLLAGYGVKASRMELDQYTQHITAAGASAQLDPVYFYVLYALWKFGGASTAKAARLSAGYALAALRLFPAAARRWTDPIEDNVDAQVLTEGLEGGEDDDQDDADEDHDEVDEEDAAAAAPDSPESEWKIAKALHGAKSPSIDKLMSLAGLREVKIKAMSVVKEVLLSKHRPADVQADTSMNFLFLGNPGCGKTTVANCLAGAMVEMGFRKNPKPAIISAQDVLTAKDPLAEFDKIVKAALGGTIVIDEAYQLKPAPKGSAPNASNGILDYLLRVCEDERLTTTFILAGYKDEVLALMSYNDGFRSRFPKEFVFMFSDYTETQLRKILVSMVSERGFRLQTRRESGGVPIARVLAQRIARGRNKKGFGNAREVRNRLDLAVNQQTSRLGARLLRGAGARASSVGEREYRTLTRADMLGDRPDLASSPLLKELDALVGLQAVKTAVRGLMELQLQNFDREMRGDKPELISLHRVFLGNPGTGKTTVARLYGCLLKEFGFLSDGDLISVTASDLVGDAVGVASTKTAEICERAKGKVLFIDEAYVLDPTRRNNAYGGNALDTLVEKIEGAAGSDMAVILAGYEPEMKALFRNCGNPGLARRFNLGEAVKFEDFTDDELRRILKHMASQAGMVIDPETTTAAIKLVSQGRRLDGFGNAGAVESILTRAKTAKAARLAAAVTARREAVAKGADPATLPALPHPDRLVLGDFIKEDTSSAKARACLEGLSNTEHIDSLLNELEATLATAKSEGKSVADMLANCHMIFTGPPGTGKTTIARRFGKMFRNLELLPKDDVVVVTGKSMQAAHVGGTTPLVLEVMKKAKGGILFIDEAYGLLPHAGNYGAEALQALLDNITTEEFHGNLIIILAGYEEQVDKLFSVNPGLRSRFDKRRVTFPAWSAEQATDATLAAIARDNKAITPHAADVLKSEYARLCALPDWASARDVFETILPALYQKRASRLVSAQKKALADGDAPAPAATGSSRFTAVSSSAKLLPPYEVEDVLAAFEGPILARSRAAAAQKPKDFANRWLDSIGAPEFKQGPSAGVPQGLFGQMGATKQKTKFTHREEEAPQQPEGTAEPEEDEGIWAALEEACAELGYPIKRIEQILASRDFPTELIDLVRSKASAPGKPKKDVSAVRKALLSQCERALTRVRQILKQMAETKTAEEQARQQKLRRLGKCPMQYDWLKVEGGYRCAGGSHFCTDAEVNLAE